MKRMIIFSVGVICLLAINVLTAQEDKKPSLLDVLTAEEEKKASSLDVLTAEEDKEANASMPCVTLSGTDSQVAERGYQRVLTPEEWAKLWQKHKGKESVGNYDFFYDPLGLPLIDFNQFMVIAIFQGSSWNSAGLNAVSVSDEVDRITFRFEDKPYGTAGANGGAQKVKVYGFFIVPKTNKPVIIEEKVCRSKTAGEWDLKQRIKFDEIRGKQ